jgi:ribosomal protein L37AE/L43A
MTEASSSPTAGHASGDGLNQNRQAVMHCPYCAEEDLFPIEGGGWECRSCRRAFSVKFLGLTKPQADHQREQP